MRAVLENPQRPTAALVGGAKVSSKIPILKHLAAKVDKLIIGGGMANTFLLAQGVEIGKSLAEPDFVETAREIMTEAKARGCDMVLPEDAVIAREFKAGVAHAIVPMLAVPSDAMILDVGPKTVAHYVGRAEGVPHTALERPAGRLRGRAVRRRHVQARARGGRLTKDGKLVTVAGGGDTVAALNAAGVTEDFTYVSTAGGAFLEWLEGRELPGVAALLRAQA